MGTRRTRQTLQLLAAMRPGEQCYGWDLAKATGLRSGTLYPILARLDRVGWVTSAWEDGVPENRPRRRYYRLTPEGEAGRRH